MSAQPWGEAHRITGERLHVALDGRSHTPVASLVRRGGLPPCNGHPARPSTEAESCFCDDSVCGFDFRAGYTAGVAAERARFAACLSAWCAAGAADAEREAWEQRSRIGNDPAGLDTARLDRARQCEGQAFALRALVLTLGAR